MDRARRVGTQLTCHPQVLVATTMPLAPQQLHAPMLVVGANAASSCSRPQCPQNPGCLASLVLWVLHGAVDNPKLSWDLRSRAHVGSPSMGGYSGSDLPPAPPPPAFWALLGGGPWGPRGALGGGSWVPQHTLPQSRGVPLGRCAFSMQIGQTHAMKRPCDVNASKIDSKADTHVV